ncbi:MAG: folate-binding protein, partial [Micrococcales bacterium]|nr:folate-binding protein [Micrococcales bacterium]
MWVSPLLSWPGAVAATSADTGVAWHYGNPVAEQRALEAGTAVVDCSHLGVVTVTGPDRLSWLHSITSQHLAHLPPRTSTETLVLSPNGHVEHAAAVVDDATTTWLITRTHQALAAWLDSMRFMLRVEVADVTDQWAAIGEPLRGDSENTATTWCDPWPTTAPRGTRYGLPDDEHPGSRRAWRLVLVPRGELEAHVAARQGAGAHLAGTWATEALRIAAWRPCAAHEVDHRTLPHELDWLRTAVHLDKGCYRGQETVARVHNLGRPPRRLVMVHLDGSQHLLPEVGTPVLTASGATAGVLTSAERHHELGPVGLAVIRRTTGVEEVLTVATADGELVAAAQEVIVNSEGTTADRLVPRGHAA